MKILKIILITLAVLIGLATAGFQLMKYNTKKASPEKTAIYKNQEITLEVRYCSPAKKGRNIFGELVPFGKVWRTGANEPTTFTTNRPIKFGEAEIDPGTYSLWSIPGEQEWEIILNSKMYDWGMGWDGEVPRQAEFDVANVNVPVIKIEESFENFTIDFKYHVNLTLAWDQTLVLVPITFAK